MDVLATVVFEKIEDGKAFVKVGQFGYIMEAGDDLNIVMEIKQEPVEEKTFIERIISNYFRRGSNGNS